MALQVGQHVISIEHQNAIGDVIRINQNGDATIQFSTPPSGKLPFGCINIEFWPVADQPSLIVLEDECAS